MLGRYLKKHEYQKHEYRILEVGCTNPATTLNKICKEEGWRVISMSCFQGAMWRFVFLLERPLIEKKK